MITMKRCFLHGEYQAGGCPKCEASNERFAGRTDKERLDALQRLLGRYTGKVVCRWSETGRGWRLHETSSEKAAPDVRQAIDTFLGANKS